MLKKMIERVKSSSLLQSFLTYYKSSELSLTSIAVAYYLILTAFPFMMLLANIFPYLSIDTSDLLKFLRSILPKQLYATTADVVTTIFNRPSSGFLWLSILTAFWTTAGSLKFLQQAFNKAYDVEEERDFILSYIVGFFVSLVLILCLAVAILFSTFGRAILTLVYERFGLDPILYRLLTGLVQPTTTMILVITLGFLYYFLPNVKIGKIRYILPGTIFSSLTLFLATNLFGHYVTYTLRRLENLRDFGSLTTFVVMLWFIFFARVLITGAILNATYQKKKTGKLELRRGRVTDMIN